MGHKILVAIRWTFFQLPSISNFVLAALGVAFIFLKEVDDALSGRRKLRWVLGIAIIVFGLLSWVSDRIQNSIESSHASQERTLLQNQIGQLISASQTQATSDDIQRVDTHLTNGFSDVIAALKGLPSPEHKPTVATNVEPKLPPALIQHIVFTQRRAPSSDPSMPYGLQTIIQSNINIQPVGFAFVCTGEVDKVDFFIAGQGAYLSVETGVTGEKRNIAFVKFSFPPLSPETPLVVTLLSKEDIRVTELEQIH